MGKINVDFQITSTHDPKYIVVIDTSNWEHISNKPSIIEILLPGEQKPVVHYFDKNRVNVFNSYNLFLNCDDCPQGAELLDLPDGIYHITVKGSPETFNRTRQFLKTDKTRLELDKYISTLSLTCDEFSKEVLERINKINLFLQGAEANTRLGHYCEAQELLFKVQKMMSKLKKCKACV